MPRGLMSGLFGGQHLAGLDEQTRRGLISDSARAAGAALLSQALNPNIPEALGSAVATGRQAGQAGAYDAMRRQQTEARIESSQALAEARREQLAQVRADTRRRLEEEGEKAQNVAVSRQRLTEAGVDVQGLGDDAVLDLAADYISRAVESKAAAAFPAPVPPDPGLTTAQESYYDLANRQADLRARELDLRAQGGGPAPAGPAQVNAEGVDIAGSLERILAAAPADKRDALRAEFERRSQAEDPVQLLVLLNKLVGSL